MSGVRRLPALVLLITIVLCVPAHALQLTDEDPDELWANREEFPSAMQALKVWDQRLKADSDDFESAWKLARACYWIQPRVSARDADRERKRGLDAARRAIKLRKNSPEGHYWLALNLGVLSESLDWEDIFDAGFVTMRRALEAVIKADPAFEQGAAHAALGRLYSKTPVLMGGNKKKAEEYLRGSLNFDSENALALFFFAEFLVDRDRKAEARAALERLLAAPTHPEWSPESREFRQKAARLLDRLEPQG